MEELNILPLFTKRSFHVQTSSIDRAEQEMT